MTPDKRQELQELQANVGLLRQWLNEDRITDVNKMVTTEQINTWLGLSKNKRVEDIIKYWLKEQEKECVYVGGTDNLRDVTIDGSCDFTSLVDALTQHHQDMMSELVEKLEEAKQKVSDGWGDPRRYGQHKGLTEAQDIIRSLSK